MLEDRGVRPVAPRRGDPWCPSPTSSITSDLESVGASGCRRMDCRSTPSCAPRRACAPTGSSSSKRHPGRTASSRVHMRARCSFSLPAINRPRRGRIGRLGVVVACRRQSESEVLGLHLVAPLDAPAPAACISVGDAGLRPGVCSSMKESGGPAPVRSPGAMVRIERRRRRPDRARCCAPSPPSGRGPARRIEIGAERPATPAAAAGNDEGADDEGEHVDREGADAHESSIDGAKPFRAADMSNSPDDADQAGTWQPAAGVRLCCRRLRDLSRTRLSRSWTPRIPPVRILRTTPGTSSRHRRSIALSEPSQPHAAEARTAVRGTVIAIVPAAAEMSQGRCRTCRTRIES